MKLSELEEQLIGKNGNGGIKTGFKGVGVDSFASFLVTKEDFPSNKEISDYLKGKKFVASEIKKDLFPLKSFDFPDDFFNESELNNDAMFVGLNAAYRPGNSDYQNWGNFRDVRNNYQNTYRLYIQTNRNDKNDDDKYRGCYITDIVKGLVGSKGSEVVKNLYKVDNKKILDNSTRTFIQECLIIRPRKLILFGKGPEDVLNTMKESKSFKDTVNELSKNKGDISFLNDLLNKKVIKITHYSTQTIPNFEDWFKFSPDELSRKMTEK